MVIDDNIWNKKLQYDLNRKAEKILALSSSKSDKYKYLISEEILPYDQSIMMEQAKSTYSPLQKAFRKQ